MSIDLKRIEDILCKSICSQVRLHPRHDGRVMVETPFVLGDGDTYAIYLEELPSGVRITDAGHTLMHLSYSMDVESLRGGTRGTIFERILTQSSVSEDEGELYLDSSLDELGTSLFVFGQAITRVYDLTFLRRLRVASTFYEDLAESLARIVAPEKIHRDYVVPTIPKGEDYPIDFFIEAKEDPLYLFGIPNRDKARLATIIIEHLLRERLSFESLLVFANQQEIPRPDLARLSNVGGEMVASLDARDDLSRKVLKRVA